MEISYNYISGQPADVIESLNRSISQYERRYKAVKIGITSNVKLRKQKHAQDGWTCMVMKYRTESVRNANIVEKYFIEHRPELVNEWTGFSPMTGHGPYYAYLLLK